MKKKLQFSALFAGILFMGIANAQTYTISTIAGTGTAGYNGDGIAATAAEINNPESVSISAIGNIYVADYSNNRVRVINTSGIITTLAKTPNYGVWAFGASALDPSTEHIALQSGTYVADFFGNRVRYVNSAGTVTIIAGTGSGVTSGDGGPATAAGIDGPNAVAADALGNVYIAENYANKIRKIDINGIITTFAGTGAAGNSGNGGPATAALLDQPTGITCDDNNNVYITDAIHMNIRKIDAVTGIITLVAGDAGAGFGGDGGPATNAKLLFPTSVAVDPEGFIYIADYGNNRVRMVNAQGIITTIAGGGTVLGDGGPATAGKLSSPVGISVDVSSNVYVTEWNGNRVRKLTLTPFTFTATQTAIGVCPNGGSATITAKGGQPPYFYSWNPGGLTTQSVSGLAAGTYTVTVRDNRWVLLASKITLTCTFTGGGGGGGGSLSPHRTLGIDGSDNVSVYPNPTNSVFNVTNLPQGSVIELYNEMGMNVKTMTLQNEADITTIDASAMANGIYFMRISDSDGNLITQQKLIKVR